MYCKILIETDLRVLTGMHIGGSSAFSSIGTVDSPVLRDTRTNLPIVPGSSLKGKLRTLLVRSKCGRSVKLPTCDRDPDEVRRLFGSSNPVQTARLQFSDAFLTNAESLRATGITEVKFENTINRETAVANPRQIERVVSGAVFAVRMVYDAANEDETACDMENLALAMKLLQLDYLGGHGTRGAGRVSFENIRISVPYAEQIVDTEQLKELFRDVEAYELLSV